MVKVFFHILVGIGNLLNYVKSMSSYFFSNFSSGIIARKSTKSYKLSVSEFADLTNEELTASRNRFHSVSI